ncbi:MAG: hypothetical protein H0X33_02815 [Taibaiella sp.]|nr:hypothetical protein [Taibaiella sp.]
MEYNLILTIDGETWQHYKRNNQEGGAKKSDKDYLERVAAVLSECLAIANGQKLYGDDATGWSKRKSKIQ